MRWRMTVPVVALLLVCSGGEPSMAQTARVVFTGKVTSVESPSLLKTVIAVRIEAVDGSRRSASLYLHNETEARLFGYGDEVMVDVRPTGRKAE